MAASLVEFIQLSAVLRRNMVAAEAGAIGGRPGTPDAMMSRIRDIEATVGMQRDSLRTIERCRCRRTVLADRQPETIAGERRDHTIGQDHTDAVMPVVGDIQDAIMAYRQARRSIEPRVDRRATVAEKLCAGTCHSADDAVGSHAADVVVPIVGDIDAAIRPHSNRSRLADCGPARQAAVATAHLAGVTGKRRNDPAWRDSPDDTLAKIGDIQAAI